MDRLPALAVLALVGAISGCAVAPHYESGKVLSTERRGARTEQEYRLHSEQHLDATPPTLAVCVETRTMTTDEERDICQKVEVTGQRRLSFEPTFLMWPLNVVRTPVGLAGCAYSAADLGLHYAGGFVAFSMGALLILPFEVTGTASHAADSGTMLLMATPLLVLETLLVPVDLPLNMLFGVPLWPACMDGPDIPRKWEEAISRSWHFAWDYHPYPPFIIWPRTVESRRVVDGETVTGHWETREHHGEWGAADTGSIMVTSGGVTKVLRLDGGKASVDLAELAASRRPTDTLDLTVMASTPKGPVSQGFSFSVGHLRGRQ